MNINNNRISDSLISNIKMYENPTMTNTNINTNINTNTNNTYPVLSQSVNRENPNYEINSSSKLQDLLSPENAIPLYSTLGECNIPSYFATSEELVIKCTEGLAKSLFKTALFVNLVFSILFYKRMNPSFIFGFVLFHIFLYYFITNIFVGISVSEWKTFQAYKTAVKKDPDFSRFDTPLTQFRSITDFLLAQPINKQKIIYLILIISFIFVWIPLIFNLSGETRFDIGKIRSKIPI